MLALPGCSPTPLAYYLKALGIFRLLSERDPATTAVWEGETFAIDASGLDRAGIEDFFLNQYSPTPVLAPWNGGSGFFPKDNKAAIGAIKESDLPRFAHYQAAIAAAETCLASQGLKEKPSGSEKETLLENCRSRFPEEALAWLDAAYVLTGGGAKYPPLLGTGGNDGRLDFTNNFMQRLTEVFGLGKAKLAALSPALLANALFAEPAPKLTSAAIGQFLPGASGGANATSGFDGKSLVNPWDFILMIEGALVFAGAPAKRLGSSSPGVLAYPFTVRHTGTGFASSSVADEDSSANRGEMWMPLWSRQATFSEVSSVFAEGRAMVGKRPARDGLDFMRAAVTLGVDRGIGSFQRFGIQVRNGLAYFAVPLDRVNTRSKPEVDLLLDIDSWLEPFRSKAKSLSPEPPARIRSAVRQLETSIAAFCKSSDPTNARALLVALGRAEFALTSSRKWATDNYLKPLPTLSPRWIAAAYGEGEGPGNTEFRLAAALASIASKLGKDPRNDWFPLRRHLEPVRSGSSKTGSGWAGWGQPNDPEVIGLSGGLTTVLNRILARRLVHEAKCDPKTVIHYNRVYAQLPDVAAFIEERTNDALLAEYLRALCLINFSQHHPVYQKFSSDDTALPSTLYALLKLPFSDVGSLSEKHDGRPKVVPAIHKYAAAGRGGEASTLAARRLRAAGLNPAVDTIALTGETVRRTAAALLFPIGEGPPTKDLGRAVLRPRKEDRYTFSSISKTERDDFELASSE